MILDDIAVGLVSGIAASGPMTMFMHKAHRALPRQQRDPLPPRVIAENLSHHAGVLGKMKEQHLFTLTMLSHFAYGGSTAALYAPLARRLKTPPLPGGVAYGLLVWAVSYLGILPALRLYPPPRRDTVPRTIIMIIAHLVWGAAMGSLVHVLQKSGDEATMSGAGRVRTALGLHRLRR